MSRSNDSAGVLSLVILAGIALWYGVVRDSAWRARAEANSQYGVPYSKIHVDAKRPHDCDFMTAPLGAKHCSYTREYRAEWFSLYGGKPVTYGTIQESPPTACSSVDTDFAHRCYFIDDLGPDEHPSAVWRARNVTIFWRKVED